jgi:hypothetical protein
MSNNPRDLVENPHADVRTARNMPDAANAGESLEGYAAINASGDDDVARRALNSTKSGSATEKKAPPTATGSARRAKFEETRERTEQLTIAWSCACAWRRCTRTILS